MTGRPTGTCVPGSSEEVGREVSYRDVEVDGAARAARRLAELL